MCLSVCENNSIKDYLAHKANGPAPIVKAEIPPGIRQGGIARGQQRRENNRAQNGQQQPQSLRWVGDWPNGHCTLCGIVTNSRNG